MTDAKQKPFTWSYTRLRDWENCPRQYRYKYLSGKKQVETEDMRWGNTVHKALEDRAKGRSLPDAMKQFEKYGSAVDAAKSAGMEVAPESQYALTRELRPTTWFGEDVYVRVVMDLSLLKGDHAMIVDYKTGKKRDDPTQLSLFAGVGFAHWPAVQTIETRYIWLKGAPPTIDQYKREDSPWIWGELLPRAERMETGIKLQQFDPRPTGLCGWCDDLVCPHNRKDRQR